ncbi:DNA/RNA non-specific endonuclease [Planktomarina temperata]|nr:DNA/RNA non-specific endonuclease [Planktomarina temperata]
MHESEIDWARKSASLLADEMEISEDEALTLLTAELLRGVSDNYSHVEENTAVRRFITENAPQGTIVAGQHLFAELDRSQLEYRNSAINLQYVYGNEDIYRGLTGPEVFPGNGPAPEFTDNGAVLSLYHAGLLDMRQEAFEARYQGFNGQVDPWAGSAADAAAAYFGFQVEIGRLSQAIQTADGLTLPEHLDASAAQLYMEDISSAGQMLGAAATTRYVNQDSEGLSRYLENITPEERASSIEGSTQLAKAFAEGIANGDLNPDTFKQVAKTFRKNRLPGAVGGDSSAPNRTGSYPNLARPTSATPANTILGDLDDLGRPTGVVSTVTPNSLGTGTSANPAIRPPGFEGAGSNHARGHLLARMLGGAGDDARNLVTLFQRNANHPNMSSFERQVQTAVRNGETVNFRAIPIYTGSNPMPTGVTLTARGSNGFDLDVSIPNVNGLQ